MIAGAVVFSENVGQDGVLSHKFPSFSSSGIDRIYRIFQDYEAPQSTRKNPVNPVYSHSFQGVAHCVSDDFPDNPWVCAPSDAASCARGFYEWRCVWRQNRK